MVPLTVFVLKRQATSSVGAKSAPGGFVASEASPTGTAGWRQTRADDNSGVFVRAPPLLDDDEWRGELGAWGKAIPRPRSILVLSAHWDASPVAGPPVSGTFWKMPPRLSALPPF